jgi:hypothetical protein
MKPGNVNNTHVLAGTTNIESYQLLTDDGVLTADGFHIKSIPLLYDSLVVLGRWMLPRYEHAFQEDYFPKTKDRRTVRF